MNISDSGEFGRRLVALAELFDVKVSAQRAALYFEALRDLPFEAVAGALNQAAKSCTFFPKPAELRTFAVGDSDDATERAWLAMRTAMARAGGYASLVVEDPALAETILAVFGTWPGACAADFAPEMWAAKRKEFGRVYRVMQQRNLVGARYLTGIAEMDNSGRGYALTHVPVARIAGDAVRTLTLPEAEQARQTLAAVSHGLTQLDALLETVQVKGLTA